MTTQTDPAAPAAPAGPVARDPLNPNVVIPVYLGGDGPVSIPASTPGDRGDTIGTPPAAPAAAEPAADTTPPADQSGDPAGNPEGSGDGKEPATADATPPADPAPPAEPAKPARNDKGQFIPRSRFNEVNEENKELKRKLAAMEKGEAPVVTPATPAVATAYDFDAAETEHANLVLDGKIAEAVKKRAEIRAEEQKVFEEAATRRTLETTRNMSVKERIDAAATQYEQTIPQFDPESEHFSEELLGDVRDFYDGALAGGRYKDPVEAFEASVKKALKLHGIETAAPAAAAEPAKDPATPPAPPVRTAQKRVEAIVGQPPSLAKVGTTGAPDGAANIDVKALPDADFARLPEATRRRLRGDTL